MEGRCPWASDELLAGYHDLEWGVPVHDDRHLFELLTLEGAQAGLSWRTILAKRGAYRAAFANFDPRLVAGFGAADVARLLADPGIVRNRQKIASTIANANAALEIAEESGSFSSYLWSFVDDVPIQHRFTTLAEVPAKTQLAEQISKELRRRKMNFVGPTIIYAYMQSAGLVMDHLLSCPRSKDLGS